MGARRHAADLVDELTAQRGLDAIAGGDRGDMGAVTVRIPGRDELVLVELVLLEEAIDVVTGADQLVVAVGGRKALARLTLALPAGRRA